MSTELEASIHLSLHNDVSAALAKIAGEVLGLDTHVGKLKSSLKEITSGAIKLSAAFGMAEFIADLAKANGMLERQLNIFRMSGNSAADTVALRAAAYDAAVKVRGVGVVEQAKLARELSSALQDNAGARSVLPDFARAKAVIAFATGRDNDEDTTRLAKMIELRGGAVNPKTDKLDAAMFRKELDAATKALVVGQGLLSTNDLQQMIKQGGPAMKNFRGNPGAFWADYLAMAEDMGGARAGTATTAIARQVLGGIMTPKVAAEWERLGMLSKEGDGWNHDKKGNVVIDDPSKAIRGYGAFQHGGVEEFVDGFVRKAFAAHGITSPDHINAEMYRFGSTETARRAYGLYMSNDAQVKATHDRYFKSMGADGFDKVVTKDLLYNEEAVKTAFEGLKTALGDAAGVAPVLGAIADGINHLSKAASEHPMIGKTVTWGGGAAAAGLGAYGIVQMIRGLMSLKSGFGLPVAATQLSAAAAALEAAAASLTGAAAAGAIAGGVKAVPRAAGLLAASESPLLLSGPGQKKAPGLGILGIAGMGLNLGVAALQSSPEVQGYKDGKPVFKPVYGDQVEAFDKWYADTVKSVGTSLGKLRDNIGDNIKGWPAAIESSIEKMGASIVASITGIFSGIGDKLSKMLHFSSFEGGGVGGGGGFIKASYETDDGGGGGRVGGGSADAIMNHAGGAGFNTRGVRNMNPGNIGYGAWARAHGATAGAGADSGHLVAVFPSFESGYAAMGSLALSKYASGMRSVDQLIAGAHGWTPGNHAAAANVAKMMGISPFGDAQLRDPNMLAAFKAGLSVQELGPAGAKYARDHLGHSERSKPFTAPPAAGHERTTVVPVHLDGKVIAKVVTKHQTKWATMPHAISGQDDYGSWASPGTTMMPV